jgi:hypothetical protein
MNKLLLALVSVSMTSAVMCNDVVSSCAKATADKEKAVEPVKESSYAEATADTEVVVAQAVVAKKASSCAEAPADKKCSQCLCTTPTQDKSADATADVKADCPCEEAGKVCPCPQMAEASVQEQK